MNTPNLVTAVIYLKRRYAEICLQYPAGMKDTTEAGYVAANLKATLRNQRHGYGHWEVAEKTEVQS